MRRTKIALVVTLLVAGGGGVTAGAGAATATVSVVPSTDLGVSATVQVTASGFPAATQLGSAECIGGAVEIGSCDLSAAVFVNSDASGAAQFNLEVRAEISTQNGPVDCTVAGACDVAVAVTSDIPDTTVTAPISFAPLPAPKAGTIEAMTAPVAPDEYQSIVAHAFAPSVLLDFSVCAHGATSPDDCDEGLPARAYVDDTGTGSAYVNVPATLGTPNGDVDCTVTAACDYAAWDIRDFSTIATSPLAVAPLVAGTLTITPSTGLHDGQVVTVTGSSWPADQYVELDECTGKAPNHCPYSSSTITDDQGRISTPFTVKTQGFGFDCDLNQCSIAVTWYASFGVDKVTAQRPITFATTPEVAHYSHAELAAMQQAASTLGISPARLQHDGS